MWQRVSTRVQRLWRWLAIILVARLLIGVLAIAVFDRDALGWGYEATVVVAAAAAVYGVVGLTMRRR